MNKIEKIMNEMINHASTAGKVKSSSAKIKVMSKMTNRIIEAMNEGNVISNCCAAELVENSYSYDEEYGGNGKCSSCNEGCGCEVEEI